jgi:hypothetical protein
MTNQTKLPVCMKTKNAINRIKKSLCIVCVLLSFSAFGKIWIVDNNAGSTSKDFTALQAAHDGAAANDTLYLIGSPTNYLVSKITVTKKLVIIGPGFFLTENPDTQANTLSAIMASTVPFQCVSIEFAVGSEGSVIMGMEIRGGILITANNILVKRNHIQETSCGTWNIDGRYHGIQYLLCSELCSGNQFELCSPAHRQWQPIQCDNFE